MPCSKSHDVYFFPLLDMGVPGTGVCKIWMSACKVWPVTEIYAKLKPHGSGNNRREKEKRMTEVMQKVLEIAC